jgi:hypothetical protein
MASVEANTAPAWAALALETVRAVAEAKERFTTDDVWERLDALEPDLAAIRDAKASWEDLRPALTPNQYPVESIYQLILLLPPEGIRVTRLELKLDGIVIDGEASSLGHGIEFRDKLVASPAFNRWQWEFPSPTSLPDGRATFRAEARPHDAAGEDGLTQEVTSL